MKSVRNAVVLAVLSICAVIPVAALPPCYCGMGTIPNAVLGPGQAFQYQVPLVTSLIDPCDFTYEFSLASGPAGMSITPAGFITWSAPQVNGSYPVTVRLRVDYTLPTVRTVTTNQAFTITVCVAADAQAIATIGKTGYDAVFVEGQVKNNDTTCSIVTSGRVLVNQALAGTWSNKTVAPGQFLRIFGQNYQCHTLGSVEVVITQSSLTDPNPWNNDNLVWNTVNCFAQ